MLPPTSAQGAPHGRILLGVRGQRIVQEMSGAQGRVPNHKLSDCFGLSFLLHFLAIPTSMPTSIIKVGGSVR